MPPGGDSFLDKNSHACKFFTNFMRAGFRFSPSIQPLSNKFDVLFGQFASPQVYHREVIKWSILKQTDIDDGEANVLTPSMIITARVKYADISRTDTVSLCFLDSDI